MRLSSTRLSKHMLRARSRGLPRADAARHSAAVWLSAQCPSYLRVLKVPAQTVPPVALLAQRLGCHGVSRGLLSLHR